MNRDCSKVKNFYTKARKQQSALSIFDFIKFSYLQLKKSNFITENQQLTKKRKKCEKNILKKFGDIKKIRTFAARFRKRIQKNERQRSLIY